MCWWTQQAIDLAIEFGLPWYWEPNMTIEMLTTHIAGELVLGPEDYEEWKETVSFWYLHFRYHVRVTDEDRG